MILTCPACTMRYLVSEGAIGTRGRRVRCANCGHQWVQAAEEGLDEALFGEGEPRQDFGARPSFDQSIPAEQDRAILDDDAAEDGLDFQSILRKELEGSPIPSGVMPEPSDPVRDQLGPAKASAKTAPRGGRLVGFAAAGIFYLLLLAALLVFQPQISRAWPPSNLLYGLLGMDPAIPGEGLALEDLSVGGKDGRLDVKGVILNLKSRDLSMPSILAAIVDEKGHVLERHVIPPPIARIKSEGSVPFEASFASAPPAAASVEFGFTYMKPAEEQPAKDAVAASGDHPPAQALTPPEPAHSAAAHEPAAPAQHH